MGRSLKPLVKPRIEGGDVVVEVDNEDFNKGVEELKLIVVGKFTLQKI